MYDELIKRLRTSCESCKLWDGYKCCLKGECSAQTRLQAADAIEELSKPRWIPVTERLPEEPGEYNVWLRCGIELQDLEFGCDLSYVTTCHFDPDQCLWDDGACRYNGFLEHVNKQRTYYITHWQPLPELPKEETFRVSSHLDGKDFEIEVIPGITGGGGG